MYIKDNIGQRIKDRRKKLKMTQTELADKINGGVMGDTAPHSQISQWEQGKKIPETDALIRLCNALECDMDYLLGAIETPRKATHDVAKQTGLKIKAVDWLLKNKVENPHLVNALSELFEYDDLADTLFSAVFDFATSHFSHIVVSDVLRHTDKRMGSGESKQILKFSVQECFSAVLDRIWDENQRVSMAMASIQVNRLKEENEEISQQIGTKCKEIKEDKNG